MDRKKFLQLSTIGAAGLGLTVSANANTVSTVSSSVAGFSAGPFNRRQVFYPEIDFGTQVFSKCGSWFIVNYHDRANTHRLYLKTLRSSAISQKWDTAWAADLYDIALYKNNVEVVYETTATPYSLELRSNQGTASITFLDNDTLYFLANELEVRLIPLQGFSWTYAVSNTELKLNLRSAKMFNHFRSYAGTTINVGTSNKTGEKGATQDVVTELIFNGTGTTAFAFRGTNSDTLWNIKLISFNEALAIQKAEVDSWMQKMPHVPEKFKAAAQTAWYLLHAFQVAPAGRITRQTLLASKNSWLTKIWSWDHCFHAMALAHADVKLAWDQLFVMFDNQDANGAFPDALDDNGGSYNFVKPPIHGWAIRNIINTTGVEASMPYLKEAYEPLARWTEYWYIYRDDNKNGMCHYLHGNDSGWDNATAFDQGIPTEGADLAAYLILQQETLAYIATLLGKKNEADKWTQRANNQYNALMKYGVKDNRFISPLAKNGIAEPTQSLINYVPIIMGKKVDDKIRKNIVNDLKPGGPYLTNYGLATEALNSPKYQYDGYWRGPIWAPPSYQIFLGLYEAGEIELAKIIAERFCTMCVNDPSFSENYDAPTGKGVQAPGVSWTPAVFMLFANWLYLNK